MFKTRAISGAIMIVLLLLFLIRGGDLLLFVIGAISVIGMYELYRVFHFEKKPLAYVGYATTIVYYLNLKWNFLPDVKFLFLISLIVMLFVFVFSYPKVHAKQLLAAFFAIFYVAMMLSCVYETRMLADGKYLVWLIFICSWGCDTCAYCVGMLFGKHKMAPVLSPKKSVEGAVGGVVGAAVLAVIFGLVFNGALQMEMNQIMILPIICAIGGLISMVGDLAASAIKRFYDIKDYGKLIPGHGGILDRFDSVIITAPIVFYLCAYLL
ncbi:phosphatidate cytidylyltransferase [Eubacterium oxidoreducens]|uniref:Phosphatidate cytidylyltransferase n=1 Tax=Eubacterium oxidoreducens TaxID=1732 RepID=A0A1G6AP50_EUBOX|nr:phosphatidate cytidylyltransferase [Eubacterium oxidoreducens]SDB10160.1 phosphatidate cytidylyltransferase [Eubacterium oxidoreducens]